jgi:hypothetical protein
MGRGMLIYIRNKEERIVLPFSLAKRAIIYLLINY